MSRHIELGDGIDARRAQWASELPDVDTRGMAILGRIRLIALHARPSIERVFSEHGLDTGEFDVLSTLLRSGPPYCLRPTELYRALMISSGGLSDRLNRLTEAGLVHRPASKGDARSLPVALTDEGRRRAEIAFRADMAVEAKLLDDLSDHQKDKLEPLLRALLLSISR